MNNYYRTSTPNIFLFWMPFILWVNLVGVFWWLWHQMFFNLIKNIITWNAWQWMAMINKWDNFDKQKCCSTISSQNLTSGLHTRTHVKCEISAIYVYTYIHTMIMDISTNVMLCNKCHACLKFQIIN